MLSQYYKNRKKKTLPVLKTDSDLEVEGLARLSIDLPSFQVTEEPDSVTTPPASSPSAAAPATSSSSASHSNNLEHSQSYRPKVDDISLLNRHSVGFDVPGAVHTIMTPSKNL